MSRTNTAAALLAAIVLATHAPVTVASNPSTKVVASDAVAVDHFGSSVAISGTLAIVGSPLDDYGGQGDAGSAYLFDTTTGQELAKLTSGPFSNGDVFGSSVGISGTTVIVGAPFKNDGGPPGSAFLFDATTGLLIAELVPDDPGAADHFGVSVAISGTLAIVGAYRDDDNGSDSGSAYLFDATTGQQVAKLLPDDGAAGDWFGISVGISGDIAIVGAYLDDDNGNGSGSAYLFDTTTGQQIDKLLPDDGAANDDFGISVALSGTTALVGAVFDDDNGVSSGSAYLFDTTTGQQIDKLLPNDGTADDWFGISVDISGTRAIVGAERKDGLGLESGAGYVFDTTTGQQIDKLVASDGTHFDRLGTAVAISGSLAGAGAYGDDPASGVGGDSGSAYFFDLDGDAWLDLGGSVTGGNGTPSLVGSGDLTPGSLFALELTGAAANASTFFVLGLTNLSAPFKGGLLVPSPDVLVPGLLTDGNGELLLSATWAAGVPSCATFYVQYWIVDGAAVAGLSASNGVSGTTP